MINTIKNTLSLLAIISTIWLGVSKFRDSKEIDRLTTNLNATTTQWQDEKGRMVTEVSELRFTNKELRKISKIDSTKLGEVYKQLKVASEIIKDLRIKASDVESANIVDLSVSNDSLVTIPVYNENMSLKALKPIKTAHLEITFDVQGNTILVNHKYRAKISTIVSRQVDMETTSGNRRFFIARWVNPRYEYSAKNVVDDKNAKIDSAIHINFQRRKGKR